MFETPRIVPHEICNDEGEAAVESKELDMSEYGECYDPNYKPHKE